MHEAKVHLVGAGPGDPELLTLKALRLIEAADVVVYDRLVAPEVLARVPPGSTRIFVGKSTSNHTLPQEEINELLARLAKPGRCVVRLKGGDPFIFGRGGEEAEYLARRGIAVEVVPGVTAAAGCAAEFGIPLTHRGLATGVRFVTGHARGNEQLELDWRSLADPDTTLVVYMGLGTFAEIAARLVEAGLPPSTPAAAIANGTTPQRQICRATLAELPQRVAAARIGSPALLVIGRVAALADVLGPFGIEPAGGGREVRHA
jgi:uroporphyrin-III C-methyltransferase/precorrin-2 dehydrogenase/sirohydrochlorin ferrochelatase/uroporphyrin-III C-methyltransferase